MPTETNSTNAEDGGRIHEIMDEIRRMIDLEMGGYGVLPSDRAETVDLIDSDDDDDDPDDDDPDADDDVVDLAGDESSSGEDPDGARPNPPPNHREFEAEDLPQFFVDEMNQDNQGQVAVSAQHSARATNDQEELDDSDDDDDGTNMDLDDFTDEDDGRDEDLTASEDRRIGRELLGFEQKQGASDNDDEDLVDGTIGDVNEDGRNTTRSIMDWSIISSLEHKYSKSSATITFEVGKPYRIRGCSENVWIWRFASSRTAYGAKVRDAKATFLGTRLQLTKKMYDEDLIVNKTLFDEEERMDLPFEKVKVIRKQPYKLDDLVELEDLTLLQTSIPEWTYSRRVKIQQGSDNPSSSYRFGYYYRPLPPVLEESSDVTGTSDEMGVDSAPGRERSHLAIRQTIPTREGLRHGARRKIRVMELFVGFGGMHQGFARISEFELAVGVELDATAVKTFRENYPNDRIMKASVIDILQKAKDDPEFHEWLGRIDHIHVSPPCQGFSSANRNGGENDEKNNNLSLIVIEYMKLFEPDAVSFENVEGMWRGKHLHYLRWILKSSLRCGYQFHLDVLKACDYGDPQTRRRFIIMASKLHIPVPALPSPTHGKNGIHGTRLLPYVTVGDVLGGFPERKKHDKYDGLRPTKSGQSKNADAIVLDPNKVAPALRATGPPVFHPFEDRALTVREYLALFSHDPETFQVHAKKRGNSASQYRQIGNSVPVKLAEALARSVAEVLRYEWKQIETTNTSTYQSSSPASSVVVGESVEQMVEDEAEEPAESSEKSPPSINDVSDEQMLDAEGGDSTATSNESQT